MEAVRLSVRRDRPFGGETWARVTANQLGLESSFRNRGHQPKAASTSVTVLPSILSLR